MKIILGNSLEKLKELEDNSIDSIVTDPPYELGFMGKKWDNTGIAYNIDLWAECLRVLKPGGHLLAFSGTRTYHRMAVAIEDAGFEVRDMIEWVYGSGFPKSLNIGKAVDKLQGNERKVLGKGNHINIASFRNPKEYSGTNNRPDITKGTSPYEGWGTALKPAHEPICMARKPLAEKNVAQNVLKYNTGGINIDESRVGTTGARNNGNSQGTVGSNSIGVYGKAIKQDYNMGRFPANLIHDNSDEVRECFPEINHRSGGAFKSQNIPLNGIRDGGNIPNGYTDSGNASRFFKSIIYNPKASKAERNKGCEELEEIGGKANEVTVRGNTNPVCLSCNKSKYDRGNGICECAQPNWKECINKPQSNNHPTVKPIALMEYLIKMVTPKGGTVLDPFMGSGSTGVAAKKNGYDFIGIDMTPEYIEIAKARINATEIENRLI